MKKVRKYLKPKKKVRKYQKPVIEELNESIEVAGACPAPCVTNWPID